MKDSYSFYTSQLNEEYRPVFDQVEMYVEAQNIDESTREERLGDLLDMFLSAQDAGVPVKRLTGNNLEHFCRTFCSDFGVKNQIWNLLDLLAPIAWLFVLLSLWDIVSFFLDESGTSDLRHLTCSQNILWYLTVVFGFYILASATNRIFGIYLSHAKHFPMKAMNAWKIISGIEAGLAFSCIFWIFINTGTSDGVPVLPLLLLSTCYLIIYRLFCGKRIRRPKVRLTDLARTGLEEELSATMEKKSENEV